MKLFVAEKKEQGYVSETDYHWCNDNDILMFGQFQTEENRKGNEVSMCGIQSRKFTTHILVKDLDIPKDFLLELITESVEKSMNCVVNDDGSYTVGLGEGWDMKFNINDILTELTNKAEKFEDGDKVICRGRVLTSVGEKDIGYIEIPKLKITYDGRCFFDDRVFSNICELIRYYEKQK